MASVVVLGPNLPGHTETFHVHAAGCADIKRSPIYRSPEHQHSAKYPVTFATAEDLVADWMSDIIAENEGAKATDYMEEFKFFPCTGL